MVQAEHCVFTFVKESKGVPGITTIAKKPTRAGCGWFVGWMAIYDIYSAKLTKLLLARGAEKTRRKILRRLSRGDSRCRAKKDGAKGRSMSISITVSMPINTPLCGRRKR